MATAAFLAICCGAATAAERLGHNEVLMMSRPMLFSSADLVL